MALPVFIYMDRLDTGEGGHTRSILWALNDLKALGIEARLRLPTPIGVLRDLMGVFLGVPKATVINALGLAYRLPMIVYICISLLFKHSTYVYWHETAWVFNRLNRQKKIFGSVFLYISRKSALQHLVTSKRAKAFCVSKGIRPDQIHVIGECVKPLGDKPFKFAGSGRRECLTVMALGSIQLRKGTDIFCEAAIQVCRELQNIEFIWIGPNIEFDPGLYEKCLSQIKIADLEDRIRFYGFLKDPLSFLAEADIYVLCSRDDPMPLSNLEAMLLSKTVVTFDVGGAPEALGGAGYVLGKPDSEVLARKIIELAALPAQTLVRKDAHKRALLEFMPGPFAQRLKRFVSNA